MRRFIEMCFDPKSPTFQRLKEMMLKVAEEEDFESR